MDLSQNEIGVVILAAGQGKRLGCCDIPKVMLSVGGKPVVSYIINTLQKCGIAKENLCLVVGFKKEKVMEYFGDSICYAEQTELKGTAHAAYVGSKSLPKNIQTILVINGDDSAFYSCETIKDLINRHISASATISVLSVELDSNLSYSRIVRHDNGLVEIIEKEYLTDEQKNLREGSTGTFCFDRAWFEKTFPNMPLLRKLGEYGLPTTLSIAAKENLPVQVVKLKNNNEWFGINTPEELKEAEERMSKK